MVVRQQVDLDTSKQMADKSIRKRRLERETLCELERQREEKARKQRELQAKLLEDERYIGVCGCSSAGGPRQVKAHGASYLKHANR